MRALALALALLGCEAPCEWQQRDYTPPPELESGQCVGMLVQPGGKIVLGHACDAEAPSGECTVLHPSAWPDQLPAYFVSSPDHGLPAFAVVPCNVSSCDAIQMAIQVQGNRL